MELIDRDALEEKEVNINKCPEITWNDVSLKLDEPIGYLEQKSMKLSIAVYKPIGWFKRLMLKWCFGLKYNTYI